MVQSYEHFCLEVLGVIRLDSEGTLRKKLQAALALPCAVRSYDTEYTMKEQGFRRKLAQLWLRLFCKMSLGGYSEKQYVPLDRR